MKKITIASLSILVAALVIVSLLPTHRLSAQANSDSFLVIVHAGNGSTSLSRSEVSDLLLKKQTRWSDGTPVKAVDLPSGSATREAFSTTVHGRTVDRVKNYWQRRIFSGRDVPPPEMATSQAVADYVRSTPGAIGYVDDGTSVTGLTVITLSD